jgi:hypothetical protein
MPGHIADVVFVGGSLQFLKQVSTQKLISFVQLGDLIEDPILIQILSRLAETKGIAF